MLLGVIADDFTGASDVANAISRGLNGGDGLATSIYIGVPEIETADSVDAGVVALKSRSIPADDAIGQSLRALDWLQSQGAEQIVFKYCSTFDSTEQGNIGPVAEALAGRLGARGVVACPAFPENGRTVYQGHLFVHDKLLNESGLEDHPLNPMTDPDIRRWLRAQTRSSVGHVPLPIVRAGEATFAHAIAECAAAGDVLVITDAVDDSDLATIGIAVADSPLVTGGSAIAAALARNFPHARRRGRPTDHAAAVDGLGAVLAGSCSNATRRQIEIYANQYPVVEIDVAAVMEGRLGPPGLFALLDEHRGKSPLAYSSDTPEAARDIQDKYGIDEVSIRLDELFGSTAVLLREAGYSRIVVAGGETSGAVVDALAPRDLAVGREIDPGVPALFSTHRTGKYALALKSGNFGAPEFFEKALAALAGDSVPWEDA